MPHRDKETGKEYRIARYAMKRESILAAQREHYKRVAEKKRAYQAEYRKKNRDAVLVAAANRYRKMRAEGTSKREDYFAAYREKNRKCIREKAAAVRKERPEVISAWKKKYMVSSLHYRLASALRRRLAHAVRGGAKNGSAVRDLGCSLEHAVQHLQTKFSPGMTWENYGKWHIDHIMPLASFDLTKRDDVLKACHYTNLQPLWAADNIRKGARIALERRPIYNEVVPQSGQRPTGASADSAMTGIVMERTLHVRTQPASPA